MSAIHYLFTFLLLSSIFSWVLFIIFGRVTVSRLRKDPKSSSNLGFQLFSGQDVLNVAQAIALPRSLTRKMSSGSWGALRVDPDIVEELISPLERRLAKVMFWSITSTGVGIVAMCAYVLVFRPDLL